MSGPTLNEITPVIEMAVQAATDYRRLTGKPLGIAGEVGEYLAAKHLNLKLVGARTPGYDAIDQNGKLIQVKTRLIPEHKHSGSQMISKINTNYKWDSAIFVHLNEYFELQAMHEAERAAIEHALNLPGSKARNLRRSLHVSKFISIGKQVWPM